MLRLALLAASVVLAAPAVPVSVPAVPVPVAAAPAPPSPVPAPAHSRPAWTAPLAGELVVTRPFDPPANPFGAGHRGVDLAGAPASVVRAAGDGTVVFAGELAGRPLVSIEHADGLRTTYEPVRPAVGAGRSVERGAPIGDLLADHSGCPVAACLHWGLRRDEAYLDPLLLLRPPHVRLLPWR